MLYWFLNFFTLLHMKLPLICLYPTSYRIHRNKLNMRITHLMNLLIFLIKQNVSIVTLINIWVPKYHILQNLGAWGMLDSSNQTLCSQFIFSVFKNEVLEEAIFKFAIWKGTVSKWDIKHYYKPMALSYQSIIWTII